MRIKVFKAADLKEAMAMVKDELGADAVILHTKRYREGGFLGYNSKEVVEVTAALEDEPKQKPRQRTARATRSKPQSAPMSVRPKKVVSQYATATATEKRQPAKRSRQVATYAEPNLIPMEALPPKRTIPSVMAKTRPVKVPVVLEQAPEPKRASQKVVSQQVVEKIIDTSNAEKDGKILALEQELAEMKSMLQQVMGGAKDSDIVTLQDILKKQEVAPEVLEDMLKTMPGMSLMLEGKSEEASKTLSKYINNKIGCTDGITLKQGQPTIVALIGTTGVGKTTTLAKIAARFVLEKGVSAALITADTYRISAVEQLKTYSDIIGLPLEIVYSPAELKTAIRKFHSKQLILIDTAGRSQNNEFQMKELTEFIEVEPEMEKHLVLSATTKDRDIEMILDKFSVCKPDCLIFTKLDETASYGPIINMLYKRQLPLSYITNGQSVPDDIVPVKPEVLTKLLLE